jgi:[glutamine synthetase] adenylyltransferase / [glutamine synthetase]-adenylyl-L-tyrosine phosphorylase
MNIELPLSQRLATPIAQPQLGRPQTAAADAGFGRPAHQTLDDLLAALPDQSDRALLAERPVRDLLLGIFSGSPYLTALILRDPLRLVRILASPPERWLQVQLQELLKCVEPAAPFEMAGDADVADWQGPTLPPKPAEQLTMPTLMARLRAAKTEIALLTALADLGGVWPVMTVTDALTRTADVCLLATVRFLFQQAIKRGEWLPADGDASPETSSGYIVLAMGKYGAVELNYSSDIDLIVFYDAAKARLREDVGIQQFFVRMTRDIVKIMQERTADGYVFRTDLRLRPDPGATQVALSTAAALHYYESFGQNWERAAMIKARPVAGDIAAGDALLKELSPYIWRKYLDYAAIADIHAMKRQIHAHKGFGEIAVAGHNIKVGRGGIREIEFFCQTQQLIAGGRQPDLRLRPTLQALQQLVARDWIKKHVREDLDEAYRYLRSLEHRLQMVADEQTHTLPGSGEALDRFARFAGYRSADLLTLGLTRWLSTVQTHYASLFEDAPKLTREGLNMVFAGEEDDPATLGALAAMGYSQPAQVISTVRGWHHGRYRAVSTPRARERLTDVQPLLIEALAATANPDAALGSFDRFLAELPASVQLFSLLRANPNLLHLIAAIMGSAPRLARILSRRRRVIDAVLDPRVIGTLPTAADTRALIAAEIDGAVSYEDALDRARVVGSEQAFLIGVRSLSGAIRSGETGGAYTLLAEELLSAIWAVVEADFVAAHGRVEGGGAVVLALGKLGGREMTATSDLDLIIVYDFPPSPNLSNGPRPLAATQYFARLTHRLISALGAPTAQGQLYEVDMRLRPSGQKGPVATQLASFIDYQANEAWTWEHMALTRARVMCGPPELAAQVTAAICKALTKPRDVAKTAKDVRDMRAMIATEKGTTDIWDLKQVRGGLVDIEFVAQYLQLVHASAQPDILHPTTGTALQRLASAGFLSVGDESVLGAAWRLYSELTQITRLSAEGHFDPMTAPDGLKQLLMRAADVPTFSLLEAHLRAVQADVASRFARLI